MLDYETTTVAQPAEVLAAVNKANAVLAQTATMRRFAAKYQPIMAKYQRPIALELERRRRARRVCETRRHVTYRRGRRAG